MKEWGKYLSWGVRGLVGVLNPERIVFGGQLAVLLPYVQDQLNEMLQSCLPDGSGYGFDCAARFQLEISKFGEDSPRLVARYWFTIVISDARSAAALRRVLKHAAKLL